MGEKKNKEIEIEKDEAEPLDDDELEQIAGGTGPHTPPHGYAPDGTILPPS